MRERQIGLVQASDIIRLVPRSRSSRKLWTITPEYRREVRAEMEKRGWTQWDLARATKFTQAAISLVVDPNGTEQSSAVPAINRVFGWPPPRDSIPHPTELAARWDAALEQVLRDHGEMAADAFLKSLEALLKPR